MATSDKDLIEFIRKGDRVAMKQLYDRFIGSLSFICSRYISDNEEVKDILHDCFIKIFSSIDKFRWQGEGSLKAWMTRIVINESLKHLRDKSSISGLSINLSFTRLAEPSKSSPSNPFYHSSNPFSIFPFPIILTYLSDKYRNI